VGRPAPTTFLAISFDPVAIRMLLNVQEAFMPLILLIVLFVILLGALPAWPYSQDWGYYPSGTAGTVLLIVLILVLLGRV
jgi:hypothetical protein